jgi:hypothetical protein
MRVVSTILLLLVAGPVLLTAQESLSSSASATTVVTAPALPTVVGGFRLSETGIFHDPMLGTHYRYRQGRNLTATVAVQPALTLERTPADSEYIITRATHSFRTLPNTTPGGIPSFDIVYDAPDSMVIGSRTVPGHVVAARVRRGAGERYEAWYIYVLGSQYVRVMVQSVGTGAAAVDSEAVRQQVEDFVRAVVPAVATTCRL